MDDKDEKVLLSQPQYQPLIPIVNNVRSRGMPRDRAWLFAGALLQYTANRGIDQLILKRTRIDDVYTGPVGNINQALRTGHLEKGMEELIALMTEGLNQLPDYIPRVGEIPTRMMNWYEGVELSKIEEDKIIDMRKTGVK
jgi:hypothetical protein